jgi:hypothetical protein
LHADFVFVLQLYAMLAIAVPRARDEWSKTYTPWPRFLQKASGKDWLCVSAPCRFSTEHGWLAGEGNGDTCESTYAGKIRTAKGSDVEYLRESLGYDWKKASEVNVPADDAERKKLLVWVGYQIDEQDNSHVPYYVCKDAVCSDDGKCGDWVYGKSPGDVCLWSDGSEQVMTRPKDGFQFLVKI